MADIKHSGYRAAATTVLSTELNGLTDNAWSALSSAQDNSTNLYLMCDVEVFLNTMNPGGLDAGVQLYIVPSVDGTNYGDYTASGTAEEQENENYFVGKIIFAPDNQTHYGILRNVMLPPGNYLIGVRNTLGATMNATGNTVKIRPWNYQVV